MAKKLSLAMPRLRVRRDALPDRAESASGATRAVAARVAAHSSGAGAEGEPVMEAHWRTMEHFLDAQRRVMESALGRAGEAPSAARDLPFVREIVSHVPGRELVARCQLTLEEDVFLRDHTLETGPVSVEDRELVGLPIVPLTISMEMLAEGAAALGPGSTVMEMRDIRAARWIALDDERMTLEIRARRTEADAEVEVELVERRSENGGPATEPLVRGVVVLGDGYSSGDRTQEFELRNARASKRGPSHLYGGTAMFHGPAFQAVEAIERVGDDGIEATLAAPGDGDLFRSRGEPRLLIDPITLDAMGQVVAPGWRTHTTGASTYFRSGSSN